MSVVVVIPTYNERENIGTLLKNIHALGIPDLRIVVVDDHSPDGTGELLDTLTGVYPLRVVHRKRKEGLGRAYVEAIESVLTLERPDYILHMDADHSHDPKEIPAFLSAIRTADVILGSRYIPGGGIENWGAVRRLLSRLGNAYARRVLALPYHDLTGGFKCYRRNVLETMNLRSMNAIGYCFLVESTFRAHRRGYIIRELPITFVERRAGKSKLNIAIIFESFWKVFMLRLYAQRK